MPQKPAKRVLFLSHYGAHPQFRELFAETARVGELEVKAIIPREVIYQRGYQSQSCPRRETRDGVEYIPGRLFNKRNYLLSGYFPALPLAILSFNPDVVVVTDDVYTADVFWVTIWRILLFRRFEIVTWSQARYFESRANIRNRLARILFGWNRRFVRKLVSRNEKEAARIRQSAPSDCQVKVVYWSTNPGQFKPLGLKREDLMKRLEIPEAFRATKIIGFVGRVVPEKGILQTVQALPNLGEDVGFLVVGDGQPEYLQQIRPEIEKLKLQGRCALLGPRPYAQLAEFYNLFDLLILPTNDFDGFTELFGRVLVEAMMCKTLVLGSTNGSIPEVIGNDECLFEQGNWDAMTQALARLLSLTEADRTRLIDANYGRSMRLFTLEASAKSLVDLMSA